MEYSHRAGSDLPTLPLNVTLYAQALPIFIKALGAMYGTDHFVARKPGYANSVIFFDRFCHDMVSLLGRNVFKVNVSEVEFIFRKAYQALSHSLRPGRVELLQLDCIRHSPFDPVSLAQLSDKLARIPDSPEVGRDGQIKNFGADAFNERREGEAGRQDNADEDAIPEDVNS